MNLSVTCSSCWTWFLNDISINWWTCRCNTCSCRNHISDTISGINNTSCIWFTVNICSWSCCSKSSCSQSNKIWINGIISGSSAYSNIPLTFCIVILNWMSNISRHFIRHSTLNMNYSTFWININCFCWTRNCIL